MSHSTSKFLALAGLLILVALYIGTSFEYFGPNPIGSTSDASAALIVPAGYAFAIWGIIYLGLLVFPITHLIAGREGHAAWVAVRQWYAANVVANGVWLVLASYDLRWSTVVVIAFMLVSLLRINVLLAKISASGARISYWLDRFVFAIYFAWITLATVLNVANDLKNTGWAGGPLSEVSWSVIMLLIAGGIAAFTALRFRSPAYAGVVVWAYAAIVVRHLHTLPTLAYLAGGVALSFLLLLLYLLLKGEPVSRPASA